MPTFDTPDPIAVSFELPAGAVGAVATDRADTVVEVRPTDPAREADVEAARQTRVDHAGGRLHIRAPRRRSWIGRGSSVDVTIELPAGSSLQGDVAGPAEIACEGRLGECAFKLAAGEVRLGETGTLRVRTALGDVTVERVTGDADVRSGSGNVRIREIGGSASISNANGDTWIGSVERDLRVGAGNGDIVVERTCGSIDAKTALGAVRIGEVVRGTVALQSAAGALEVGVREGTAAWLDLSSGHGHVRSALDAADGPGTEGETVEIRGRTSYGDIVVRRS